MPDLSPLPVRGAQARIGVAVAVPEPLARRLRTVREQVGDPAAGVVPPHITLVPPTTVAADALPMVIDHLRSVAAAFAPFVLGLAGAGSFRPVSPVVFVRVVRGGPTCAAIEQAARRGVLEQELRFPYHPHVTVAHGVEDRALDVAEAEVRDFSAEFLTDHFSLYEQGPDGLWRAVDELVLSGRAGDAAGRVLAV